MTFKSVPLGAILATTSFMNFVVGIAVITAVGVTLVFVSPYTLLFAAMRYLAQKLRSEPHLCFILADEAR